MSTADGEPADAQDEPTIAGGGDPPSTGGGDPASAGRDERTSVGGAASASAGDGGSASAGDGGSALGAVSAFGGVDEQTSRRRALGAGIGLLVVALAYGPSRFGDQDRWWAAGLTILVAVVLADALLDLRTLLPTPGVAPATIVVALVAVFLCVPETDQIAIAAFVPVVVVALEIVEERGQVGPEWYAIAAASVGWAAMFGASGRQSAPVGALFAWWAVLLVPLVHRVKPIPNERSAVAVAVIGGVAAIVMARTGGIADSGVTATFAAVALGLVSFGLAYGVVALPGPESVPDADT